MAALVGPLAALQPLVGRWHAVSRLWFEPGSAARESASLATVEPVAQGRGLSVRYTWAFEGAPQDGLLLVMSAPVGPARRR